MSISVCVFCGSSPGSKDVFVQVGKAVGAALAEGKMRLVYGGGHKGLMGAVAAGAASRSGKILGIVPEAMLSAPPKGHPEPKPVELEKKSGAVPSGEGTGATLLDTATQGGEVETVVVDTMHTRKLRMAEESQAFLVLPGGFGTFEEALEMITWNQIGVHKKPVIVVNVEGFFDPLQDLVQKGTEMGFIPATSAGIVRFVNPSLGSSAEELVRDAVKAVSESVQEMQSWQGGYWSWGSKGQTVSSDKA